MMKKGWKSAIKNSSLVQRKLHFYPKIAIEKIISTPFSSCRFQSFDCPYQRELCSCHCMVDIYNNAFLVVLFFLSHLSVHHVSLKPQAPGSLLTLNSGENNLTTRSCISSFPVVSF